MLLGEGVSVQEFRRSKQLWMMNWDAEKAKHLFPYDEQ